MRRAYQLTMSAEEVGFERAPFRMPLPHIKLRHNLKKFKEFLSRIALNHSELSEAVRHFTWHKSGTRSGTRLQLAMSFSVPAGPTWSLPNLQQRSVTKPRPGPRRIAITPTCFSIRKRSVFYPDSRLHDLPSVPNLSLPASATDICIQSPAA
jgi:hypothetical protein